MFPDYTILAEISSTQEICKGFTHIIYCIWVNSVQISWVLEISMAFLKETDFSNEYWHAPKM